MAATKIHGITNEDVRGCTITAAEIAEWIALTTAAVQDGVEFGSCNEDKLPLIAAHNAGFDRPMVEALFPEIFAHLPWACSHTQVPWADHGYEGTKLAYLAMHAGLFYDARHSALADADAVVELLRQRLGERSAMAILRDAARQDTSRIYVTTSYDPKIIAELKARGYRWSPGDVGPPASLVLGRGERARCRARISRGGGAQADRGQEHRRLRPLQSAIVRSAGWIGREIAP